MRSVLSTIDAHITNPTFIELKGYLLDRLATKIPPYGERFANPMAKESWARYPGLHRWFVSLESFTAYCIAVAERDLEAMCREDSRMMLLRVREALDALGGDASEASVGSISAEAWELCRSLHAVFDSIEALQLECQAYVDGHAGALGAA